MRLRLAALTVLLASAATSVRAQSPGPAPASPAFCSLDDLRRALGDSAPPIVVDVGGRAGLSQDRPGSIPGAVAIDRGWLLRDGPAGVAARAAAAGLAPDRPMVVVQRHPLEGFAAAHVAWALEAAGARDVAVLQPGLAGWWAAGGELQAGVAWIGSDVPPRPDLAAAWRAADDRWRPLAALDTVGPLLVDARDDAAFLGWPRDGRSGHIPGARQLDARLLCEDDGRLRTREQLEALVTDRLGARRAALVHADDPGRAAFVARVLRLLGWPARVVDGRLADRTGPLVVAPGFERVVDPAWVEDLVEGRAPAAVPGRPWRILHCAWGGEEEYALAHVRGAVHVDTDRIERLPVWRLNPDDELRAVALGLGITADTTVVVYGPRQMGATRVALALTHLGVRDVRLLNGGLRAWVRSGRAPEAGRRSPAPATAFGEPAAPLVDPIVHIEGVKAMLGRPGCAVVSVRSRAEQAGETSGYADLDAKGRIRGDVWCGGGTDPSHLQAYEDEDGTLRSPVEIAERWTQAGLRPDQRIAFYCGGGWRASVAWWHARVLGWDSAQVYDPGWYEWGRDPANPQATGSF